MVIKIRFGRGPTVARRKGKNGRVARLAASLLTLVSISCASLGLWRVGTDLDLAGDFVFTSGLRSHWQVWIGAAVAIQYVAWRLNRYSGLDEPGLEASESVEESAPAVRATADARS